jgi:hypothetical protein
MQAAKLAQQDLHLMQYLQRENSTSVKKQDSTQMDK